MWLATGEKYIDPIAPGDDIHAARFSGQLCDTNHEVAPERTANRNTRASSKAVSRTQATCLQEQYGQYLLVIGS